MRGRDQASRHASVAGPILAFLDRLREQHTELIVVLIPVAVPTRLRYTFLHDHLDLVLTAALRHRPDIVTARVPVPVQLPDGQHGATGSRERHAMRDEGAASPFGREQLPAGL